MMMNKAWTKPAIEVAAVREAQGGVGPTNDKTTQHAS